jgi:hypothetical protein
LPFSSDADHNCSEKVQYCDEEDPRGRSTVWDFLEKPTIDYKKAVPMAEQRVRGTLLMLDDLDSRSSRRVLLA